MSLHCFDLVSFPFFPERIFQVGLGCHFSYSFFSFYIHHFVSKKSLKKFDCIFTSPFLVFLHPTIHLLLILPLCISFCLHLFSLSFSFLGSVAVGPKELMWGRSICCRCLSFAYPSTLSITVPEVSDSGPSLFLSVPLSPSLP